MKQSISLCRIGFLIFIAALSACVFTPKQTEGFDARCATRTRSLSLTAEGRWEQAVQACRTGDPRVDGACLSIAVSLGAASAVVSGSLVVVGNTLYWLEEQGRCAANKLLN